MEPIIKSFKTESGVVLPQARIVYGTYGKLNSAGSNAVLLSSHYMADLHGYEWLMKTSSYPNGALDPDKLFLVTSELFGKGHSSSRPADSHECSRNPSVCGSAAIFSMVLARKAGSERAGCVPGVWIKVGEDYGYSEHGDVGSWGSYYPPPILPNPTPMK